MSVDKEVFSKRIRELREERHMSQRDAAKLINASPATWSQWESQRRTPTLVNVTSVSYAFDVSVEYLTGESNERGSGSLKHPELTNMDYRVINGYLALSEKDKEFIDICVQHLLDRKR